MPRRKPRRTTLRGWWKCLPILAPPLALLLGSVWMQNQTLANQYRADELNRHIRDLEHAAENLQNTSHQLGRIERVTRQAPDLGLKPPEPGDLVEIVAEEQPAGPIERTAIANAPLRRATFILNGNNTFERVEVPARTPDPAGAVSITAKAEGPVDGGLPGG